MLKLKFPLKILGTVKAVQIVLSPLGFVIDPLGFEKLHVNDSCGYVFEVDLEVPVHLHNKQNDYPLAPERLEINKNMLSTLQENVEFPEKQKGTTPKFAPNL